MAIGANVRLSGVEESEQLITRLSQRLETLSKLIEGYNAELGKIEDKADAEARRIQDKITRLTASHSRVAGAQNYWENRQSRATLISEQVGVPYATADRFAATAVPAVNRSNPADIANLHTLSSDAIGKLSRIAGQMEGALQSSHPAKFNSVIQNYDSVRKSFSNESEFWKGRNDDKSAALADAAHYISQERVAALIEQQIKRVFEPLHGINRYVEQAADKVTAHREGDYGASIGGAKRSSGLAAGAYRRLEETTAGLDSGLRDEILKHSKTKIDGLNPSIQDGERIEKARKLRSELDREREKIESLEARAAGSSNPAHAARWSRTAREKGLRYADKVAGLQDLVNQMPAGDEKNEFKLAEQSHGGFAGSRIQQDGERRRRQAEEKEAERQMLQQARAEERALKNQASAAEKEQAKLAAQAKREQDRMERDFERNQRKADNRSAQELRAEHRQVEGARFRGDKQFRELDELLGQSDSAINRRWGRLGAHDQHGADKLQGEIYNLSARIEKWIDAVERQADQLSGSSNPAEQLRGKHLRDLIEANRGKLDDARQGAQDNMRVYGQMGEGIGASLRRELRRLPGFGAVDNATNLGKKLEKLFDNSNLGKYLNGGAKGLSGGHLPPFLEGNPMGEAGFGMGKNAANLLGKVARHPATWVAGGTIAAARFLSSKAEKDVSRTQNIRAEEEALGNVGNALGTSERLMGDLRHQNGRVNGGRQQWLLDLGYGAGDMAGFMRSSGIAGDGRADLRRDTTRRGLHLSRAYDLDVNEVGGVANQMYTGDRSGAGLDASMNKFALILAESVKKGVSSDETTRAFSSVIDRARGTGGGILGEKQRDDLLSQILAANQSGEKRLQGQLGADFVSGARENIASATGKDMSFFGRSIYGKTGAELGLDQKEAGEYDRLKKAGMSAEAIRYAQSHLTGEMTDLQTRHVLKTYGANPEMLRLGLRGLNVPKADAGIVGLDLYEKMQGHQKGGMSQDDAISRVIAENAYLKTLAGQQRIGPDLDPYKQSQGGNQGYQRARLWGVTREDLKTQKEGVAFGSSYNDMNVERTQRVGRQLLDGRGRVVETNNHFSTFDGGPNHEAVPARAQGGPISGPGNDTSDSILARLSNGEFVVQAKEARRHRHLLEAINRGSLPAFKTGGNVGSASSLGGHDLTDSLDNLNATIKRVQMDTLFGEKKDTGGDDRLAKLLERLFAPLLGTGGGGGFLGGLVARAGGVVGSLLGGDRSSPIETGVASAGGARIADTALKALGDPGFVSALGRCSQFTREVTEAANGLRPGSLAGGLYRDEARQTGLSFQQRGWGKTPEELAKLGVKLAPGDQVFQMRGSGDYDGDGDDGHTGIVGPDGKSVIENSTRGGRGKQITSLADWGKIDLVGRYGGFKAGAPNPAGITGDVATFIKAIAEQESGHDYSAVNKRTGALGKYQVMPQNLDGSWGGKPGKKNFGWDYDALGRDVSPQEFLKNPALQEKIAAHQLKQAHGKYGAAGAARWWYSNSAAPSSRRPAGGEPSPDEYSNSVMGRMKRMGASAGGGSMKVEVSGNININGKPDEKVTRAVSDKVVAAMQGNGGQRLSAVSARPG